MGRFAVRSGTLRTITSLAFAGVAIAVFIFRSHPGVTPGVGRAESESLLLASSSFREDRIPTNFTCDGANASPALSWSAPPPGTKSLALMLYDRDAPSGSFVHWVLFNVPPETRSLPEALPALPRLPDSSRQGLNDFGRIGYGGPCPPDHNVHRYVFSLLALDTSLDVLPGASLAQVEAATEGHVLAHGTLIGVFSH